MKNRKLMEWEAHDERGADVGKAGLSSVTLFKRTEELGPDINSPEMKDVDVETIMGRVRRRVHGPPDARYIMAEIERATLKSDSIVTGRISDAREKADGDVHSRPAVRGWKNRMKGTQFGIWTKKYNNTETGESPWIYPEFKGYYSNLYWCKFKGEGHSFTVSATEENIFLRLFTPAWKTDQWHNYEPIFPGGDISFMQGISSIGTKNQRAETTGPMGFKNIFYDYEKDPSRALKMVLYFDFSGEKKL